jgi:hypothetical protein
VPEGDYEQLSPGETAEPAAETPVAPAAPTAPVEGEQ